MTKRVFNFTPGPAMLPLEVLEQIQAEFLDYQGLGASLIEISHRSPEFEAILSETDALIRELAKLPEDFAILYVHGSARMQFSAIPLNFKNRVPSQKMLYFHTGSFAKMAMDEAKRYGPVHEVASSKASNYDRIPEFDPAIFETEAAYVHLTSNNTIFGTRWQSYPDTQKIPLIVDATSDIFSRVIDYSRLAVVYAGLQKNLGPSGMALVLVRKDLLKYAAPETPTLLHYATYEKDHSLTNTTNTFAIYVMQLVLRWLKKQGGISAIESLNNKKAELLYHYLDRSALFVPFAHSAHRSTMNVTFNLKKPELDELFLKEALQEGLYALKGHRSVGGMRASLYNAMPLQGVQKLVQFMEEFERQHV
jgi:phosphoserine aminotransferase